METHVVLFLTLFMQALGVVYLCLHTARHSLKIPYWRAFFQCLAAVAVFSVFYALIPPRSWMMVVLVTALCIVGWGYLCAVCGEPKGKLLFVLQLSVVHLFLCNTLWLLGNDIVSFFTPYRDTAWYNILLLGVPLVAMLPLFSRLLERLWNSAAGLEQFPWYRLSLIPASFVLLYIASYLLRYFGHVNLVAEHVIMLTITLCFFTTVYQVIFAVSKAAQAARYAENLRMVESQIEFQSARVGEIAAHENELRRMRHDFRQHLAALYAFLAEQRYEAAGEYLARYVRQVDDLEKAPLCENEVVDTIARYYIAIAKQDGIDVQADISLSNNPGVPRIELCVLLGNLFENAIQAAQKLPEGAPRAIKLRLYPKGGSLLLSMRNTFDGQLNRNREGTLRSTKPKGGGFGLPSIEAIAEKNGGQARFYRDNGFFVAEILLYTNFEAPEARGI